MCNIETDEVSVVSLALRQVRSVLCSIETDKVSVV